MNDNIEKLCAELLHYDDMIFGWRETVERAAKAIVLECINCYSPDDSATDWADKMRRMIEP
jgi:hypothetical protein